MFAAAIAALLGSAASAHLVGYAFTVPRESFWRTKVGILALVVLALSLIPLPPQLLGMESAAGPLSGMLGGASLSLAWPDSLPAGLYIGLWLATTVAGFLVGIRIWQLGTPEWRGGQNRQYDASPASRVTSMLPMANHIEEALDTLGRAGLTPRDLPRVADDIREAGRRFANGLPPSDGEVYKLVSSRVPATVASSVTGLLLEGAGRRGAR